MGAHLSVNTITSDTLAFLSNSTVEETEDGDPVTIQVEARDSSGIFTVGGAVGFSSSITLGAAIGINNINNDVKAYLEETDVEIRGALLVDAKSTSIIFGVTVGIGIVSNEGRLAGVGSVTVSDITGTTEAYLSGTDANTIDVGETVTVTATDSSDIDVHAGGVAVAIPFFAGTSRPSDQSGGTASAAFGGSVAVNRIGTDTAPKTTKAFIEGVNVEALGTISLIAAATTTIDSLTIGGGADVTTNKNRNFVGTGAGVVSVNTIWTDVRATISNSESVASTNGSILLAARDESNIIADAGAVAIAADLTVSDDSSRNIQLAIGIGAAHNEIHGVTKTSISASNVSGATGVELDATNNLSQSGPSIRALTFGVGSEVGQAQNPTHGFSFAGGGAGSQNTIRQTVESVVMDSHVVSDLGMVTVDARDFSYIDADAGGVGVIGKIGSDKAEQAKQSFGIGVTLNDIQNTIHATVTDSTIHALGDVVVRAASSSTINAFSLGGSILGDLTKEGGDVFEFNVSGGGAGSKNLIDNEIFA
ncbi:MAG: hypothetical protein KDA84_28025, partial [Planctomycetaceae bacterium]|nr:hypothetical protein [Planctomycetaceae bacterium]